MVVAAIDIGSALLAVVVGYLLGSIPVAVVVASRGDGPDPRTIGDRNPGYWNVKEHFGRAEALVVFAGDTLKGAAAGGVGVALAGPAWGIGYAAVAGAMVGHAFPLFARFRGGRSILTFVGGAAVIAPLATALAVGGLLVTWAVSRSFAVAARVGVFGFPLAQALVEPKERVAASGGLLCIIGVRFAQAAYRQARSGPAPAQE